MRRRRFEHKRNGLLAPAERHLSDQQLVDLVIGASSRAGKLSARHHLAACSLCRQDLDNLRGVDRQLELEGGGRRLAAIPRRSMTTHRWWQQVVVPLMVAACAVLVLKVAIRTPKTSARPDDRVAVVAVATTEPSGTAEEPSPRRLPAVIEAEPVAVEVIGAPAVAAPERTGDLGTSRGLRAPSVISPGVSVAAPRRAATPAVQRYVDPTSRVTRRRHPGAGRNDDRVSPPPRELGI